jgi:biopolymer transport protein ExbB
MPETTTDAFHLGALWEKACALWLAGGWAMIGIAAVALVMFATGLHVYLRLRAKGFGSVPERIWRRWIDHPDEREGPIGELLDFVGGSRSLEDTTFFFQQVRAIEAAPFERDLRVMKVCVSAAPLVGLLGTVSGMLTTFGALATGSGGAKTMGLVAAGISEALITTETGLVIALPGLFFQYLLARNYERYKAFLAHVETVCTQERFRRTRKRELRNTRQAALRQVARLLHGAAS